MTDVNTTVLRMEAAPLTRHCLQSDTLHPGR